MPGTPDTDQDMLLMLGRVDANVATLLDRTATHEVRLRAIERSHWTLKAAMAGLAALIFKDHVPGFVSTLIGAA